MFRMYDGSEIRQGYKKQSTKCEMFSIGVTFEDTVGLPGLLDFWIFDKR